MTSWKTSRIDQLGTVVTGKTPSSGKPDEFGNEYPFITPSDMPGTQKRVKVERYLSERGAQAHRKILLPTKSTCVVCIGATIGKVCMTNQVSASNQQINSIIPASDINADFVYYISTILKDTLVSFAGGAATPIVNKSSFSAIKTQIPELSIQRKIAAILSAYDELIENNNRRIALLEKIAEEIYREWFVRLRFPGHRETPIVKRIPTGWDFDRAGKFFGLVKGKSYGGDEITDNPEHMPFINLKSFNRGGGYRQDGLKYYSGRFKHEQVVRKNDVVMAVTDMTQDRAVIGRVARVPDVGTRGAVVSLDTVKLLPHNINRTYLYAYMRYSGFGEFIKEFANGTNVLHLKPELITKQRIVVPESTLQDDFASKASPLYSTVDVLGELNRNLATTRDTLLPRLISGNLIVENLDIQFPPSMIEESASTTSSEYEMKLKRYA